MIPIAMDCFKQTGYPDLTQDKKKKKKSLSLLCGKWIVKKKDTSLWAAFGQKGKGLNMKHYQWLFFQQKKKYLKK